MNKELLTTIVIAVVASATFTGILLMQKTYSTTENQPNLLKLKGHVTLMLKDQFGKVKDYREFDNVVVKNGQDLVGKVFFSGNSSLTSPTSPNNLAIGNSTTAASNTQTALGAECQANMAYTRQAGTVTDNLQGTSSSAKVTISGTFGAGNCKNGNGSAYAVSESGLFDSTTVGSGNMFARQQFSAINKGPSDSLTVTWTITLS